MTPRTRAEQMLKEIGAAIVSENNHVSDGFVSLVSKKLAIMQVNEVLLVLEYGMRRKFYLQVKQEIENIK